jgi:hypothetical protein
MKGPRDQRADKGDDYVEAQSVLLSASTEPPKCALFAPSPDQVDRSAMA